MPPAAASLSSQTDDIRTQQRGGIESSLSSSSSTYYISQMSPQSVLQYGDGDDYHYHDGMYCMEILPFHDQNLQQQSRATNSDLLQAPVQRPTFESFSSRTNQRLLQRFRSFVRRRRRYRKSISKATSRPPTAASTPSTTTTTTKTGKLHYFVQKLANIAFILCIIDCTVLPVVTFLLPIISSSPSSGGSDEGIGNHNGSDDSSSWLYYLFQFMHYALQNQFMNLHPSNLGNWLAIWFVLPIGSISAILNYYISHQQLWLLSIATFGLACVCIANCDHQHHQIIMNHHHLINIVGCICLLGSNYITRRFYGCCIDHNLHHQQHVPSSRVKNKSKTSSRISNAVDNDGIMSCTVTTTLNGSPLTKRHAACYCHRV